MNNVNSGRKIVKVDLKALTGKVFVGRENGRLARQHFKLDSYSEKNEQVKFLIPQDTISVNSSFFLGLFGSDVQRIGDFDKFFQYVDITEVDERYQEQLQISVRRTLSTSDYGL